MKKQGSFLFISHLAKDTNNYYQCLLNEGYTFTYVNTNTEALKFFNQQKKPFDLIITEFSEAKINGSMLISHLRQQQHLHHSPIICILDNNDRQNVITAYNSGAKHCIAPNLDNDTLISIVENCILADKNRQHKARQQQTIRASFEACQITSEFFIESLQCPDHKALADLLLETVKTFYFETDSEDSSEHYLRCTIRMQGNDDIVHVSDRGMISKIDCSILRRAVEQREIIEKTPYTALPSASGNTSILIRNTPENPKEATRAIAIIQGLIDRFDDRLTHFHQELQVRRQKEELETKEKQIHAIVTSCANELEQVNVTYQEMKERHMDIMEGLTTASLTDLETLSDEQTSKLQQNISAEMIKTMELYGEDQITDQKFLLTIQELHRILGQEDDESGNLVPDQMAQEHDQGNVDDLLASLGL